MKTLVILIATFLTALPLSEQQLNVNNEKTNLTIIGTSSLHDWEIVAESCKGSATVVFEEGEFSTFNELTFTVEVASLESGNSGMDDNTIKALKGEEYPQIQYSLIEINPIEGSDNRYRTKGKLSIAGTTKIVTMNATIKSLQNAVEVKGDITFKMTDFNVDPPTAVFGTIKTGNEVTIKFTTEYSI